MTKKRTKKAAGGAAGGRNPKIGGVFVVSAAPPATTGHFAVGRITSASRGLVATSSSAGAHTPRRRWRHFIAQQLFRMEDSTTTTSGTGDGGGAGGEGSKAGEAPSGLVRVIRIALPHVTIFSSTILYSLFGALVFQRLERPFELAHLQKHSLAIAQAQNAVIEYGLSDWQNLDNSSSSNNASLGLAIDELIRVTMQAFEEGIRADEMLLLPHLFRRSNWTIESKNIPNYRPKWNFHSSLFFTATLLTSIGYGNLVPISPLGRLFCVLYALLGIPLTLVTIADVAKFFGDMILISGTWLEDRLWPCGGAKVMSEAERAQRRRRRQRQQREEGERWLKQPGPYTKAFVLCMLLVYMLAMALLFSRLQPGWDLLGSLYFTLITLVTIGFGDYCPPSNTEHNGAEDGTEGHYGGWILFIFVGLTLSTLTVDMVGSSYIDRIHTLGRGFHLGSFLTMLKLGRGDCPDSARLLAQLHAGAYIPADLKLIPYIDALICSRSSAETLLGGSARGSGEMPPSPPPPPPPSEATDRNKVCTSRRTMMTVTARE